MPLCTSEQVSIYGQYNSFKFLFHRTALQNEAENQPSMETVISALFKESRKENIPYKVAALACLASVLEAHEIDRFQELSDIVYPVVSKVSEIKTVSPLPPIGIWEQVFTGGGVNLTPPSDLGAAKFCMDVKTHVKSIAIKKNCQKRFIYYIIMIYAN